MLRIFLARLIRATVVMLGVCSLVFFLIHAVPGDPVEAMLGEFANLADREQLRQVMGLNRPVVEQWAAYMSGLFQGDMGFSLYSHEPVWDLLAARIPVTLQLALAGMAIAMAMGIPAGVWAALHHQGRWDSAIMVAANLGVAIPNFVLGPLLILVFSVQFGWLPVSGYQTPGALLLPALTLGSAFAGVLGRMVRSSLLEVLHEDYIRTARAKGLGDLRVIIKHALPNAMLPVITLLGLQLGALLAGTVITEVIFSWPGLGSLLIESIERRDYPVLQACVLLISASYVLVNLGTDILYVYVDPRLRQQTGDR